MQPPTAPERAAPDEDAGRKPSSIVTYVHRYKRPSTKKKPKGPTIDEDKAVVQAKPPRVKAKAATTQKPVIVTSIGRKEARQLAYGRAFGHDDDDAVSDETDAVLSARYRAYIQAALGTKTPKRAAPKRTKRS